jgi:hypothetical protein
LGRRAKWWELRVLMLRFLAVVLTGLALTACASKEQQIAAAAKIQTEDDQFKPYRQYSTGRVKDILIDVGSYRQIETELLANVQRTTGARAFGLQVEIKYTGPVPRKYTEARNVKAEQLQVDRIFQRSHDCSRKLDSCDHKEIVLIQIKEAALRAVGNEGYRLKLYPKIGQGVELNIPKSLTVALFATVDAGEKQVAVVQPKP